MLHLRVSMLRLRVVAPTLRDLRLPKIAACNVSQRLLHTNTQSRWLGCSFLKFESFIPSTIGARQSLLSTSSSSSPPPSSSDAPAAPAAPAASTVRPGNRSHVHFKESQKPHPLVGDSSTSHQEFSEYETDEYVQGDHTGRQQNHIWTKEELEEKMSTLYRHKPKSVSDQVANKLMYGLYNTFNFVTGYSDVNPSVKSIQWRLIILESIAGVPGFVAAGFRHFKSLRTLQRDHGWIATLLEEAENERMHLLVCLKMFKAGYVTRVAVVAAQMVMTPLLMAVYMVHPKSMHRFVGYLEETACHTYVSIIENAQTEGSHLNVAWRDIPAPDIAKGYWKQADDAMFVDTLMCMCADETHHRDVNHTFADMDSDDPNPYVMEHKEDALRAWRMSKENVHSDGTKVDTEKMKKNI
jgi:hypothetical protein